MTKGECDALFHVPSFSCDMGSVLLWAGRHSTADVGEIMFSTVVHLVFVTKYRYRTLDGDAINHLRAIFSKVCTDFESELVAMDGEDNYVHLLVNYPPKHSLSALVNSLKGVSSRVLRLKRPDLVRRYWKGVLWSPSYFAASCGGIQ